MPGPVNRTGWCPVARRSNSKGLLTWCQRARSSDSRTGRCNDVPEAGAARNTVRVFSLENVVLPHHALSGTGCILESSPSFPGAAPGNGALAEVVENGSCMQSSPAHDRRQDKGQACMRLQSRGWSCGREISPMGMTSRVRELLCCGAPSCDRYCCHSCRRTLAVNAMRMKRPFEHWRIAMSDLSSFRPLRYPDSHANAS